MCQAESVIKSLLERSIIHSFHKCRIWVAKWQRAIAHFIGVPLKIELSISAHSCMSQTDSTLFQHDGVL